MTKIEESDAINKAHIYYYVGMVAGIILGILGTLIIQRLSK